jgi:uncharacterized secreted protein with C-terminal beta-propeller domain
MFHPFEQNLSELKDSEIDQKIQELMKKYSIAQRLGHTEILTQLATFANIYKEEQRKRYHSNLNNDIDKDLDTLINVD